MDRYPCCNRKAYRFHTTIPTTGCKFKNHTPHIRDPQHLMVLLYHIIYNIS